jgi:hypothetical protein
MTVLQKIRRCQYIVFALLAAEVYFIRFPKDGTAYINVSVVLR